MRISFETAKQAYPEAIDALENRIATSCEKEYFSDEDVMKFYVEENVLNVVLLANVMIKLRWIKFNRYTFDSVWECVWVC